MQKEWRDKWVKIKPETWNNTVLFKWSKVFQVGKKKSRYHYCDTPKEDIEQIICYWVSA